MNDTDIDFEDQVRRMLSDRAADIPDRPRRELLAVPALRPDLPTARSRRRVHVAVAAAAVLVVMAGLVLRPDDTNDISTVPADTPDQPAGLPSTFDASTAPFVFSAPGDAEAVTDAYLRARFPDYPAPGVVAGPVTSDGSQALATWTLTGESSAPYSGTILLRSDNGAWGVVAATTDGVDLSGVTFDGRRVQGGITYSGVDILAVDVTSLADEPVEGAPRPNGYPGANYRYGTAGDSDTGTFDLDLAATGEAVIVRAQHVGGTLLSIAEIALVGPPLDGPAPGSGFVVWPNEATTADRTSAITAASSFATEVIGLAPTTVTPDPEAAPDGPTWVELELEATSVRLLAVPTEDGWVVIQVGDGGPSVSADPPMAHVAPVTGATDIEIRIDTTRGVNAVHLVADVDDVAGAALGRQLAEGYALEAGVGEIRSIIAIYRDAGGAVLAVHGGHYG